MAGTSKYRTNLSKDEAPQHMVMPYVLRCAHCGTPSQLGASGHAAGWRVRPQVLDQGLL